MAKKKRNMDLLFRIAGLLCVGLIGLLVMVCGLALAFGNFRLSTILFFIVVALLVVLKVVTRSYL
jgi:hypothetical protein